MTAEAFWNIKQFSHPRPSSILHTYSGHVLQTPGLFLAGVLLKCVNTLTAEINAQINDHHQTAD